MIPEYRKMLWGPLRGDGQTFQGGGLVSLRPPGFENADKWVGDIIFIPRNQD